MPLSKWSFRKRKTLMITLLPPNFLPWSTVSLDPLLLPEGNYPWGSWWLYSEIEVTISWETLAPPAIRASVDLPPEPELTQTKPHLAQDLLISAYTSFLQTQFSLCVNVQLMPSTDLESVGPYLFPFLVWQHWINLSLTFIITVSLPGIPGRWSSLGYQGCRWNLNFYPKNLHFFSSYEACKCLV